MLRTKERLDTNVTPILSLGALVPRMDRADSVAEIATTGPRTAISLLRTHKVVSYVGTILAELDPSPALQPFLTEFRGILDLRRRRTELIDSAAQTVASIADRAGIPVFGVKGLAARTWYPQPTWRDLNDLDLFVANAEEAWHLARLLRREGFEYDEEEIPWFKVDVASGHPYGQVAVQRGGDDLVTTVDIHFGGYSVRHCGLLPVDTGPARRGLQTLSPTSNLAMVIANTAGDHFITLKDLNDLYLCLARDDVDWTQLVTILERGAIYGAFWSMLTQLERFFVIAPAMREVISTLPAPGTREPLPPLTRRSPRRRRLVVMRSAWAVTRRRSRWFGLRTVVNAAWYYSARLHPRLTRRASSRLDLTPRRLNNWSCIRLLPPSLVKKVLGNRASTIEHGSNDPIVIRLGPFRVRRTRQGDLVQIGDECFVPTISGRFSTAIGSAALASRAHGDSVVTTLPAPHGGAR